VHFLDVVLDFGYVICQKRLSSARLLIKTGIRTLLATIGIGSIMAALSYNGISFSTDSNEPVVSPLIINSAAIFGLLSLVMGVCLEFYERILGEAAKFNRSKSIDLRSLSKAHAPKLLDSFPLVIESSGIHNDLFLHQDANESVEAWLKRSTEALSNFANINLARMNEHERNNPLAIGAVAHIPHCFALGFLIANRRLTNYYCWYRDLDKAEKNRWIDCRDKRTRGKSIKEGITVFPLEQISPDQITKLGISIELSLPSDPKLFRQKTGVDVVYQISAENKSIGNLFSEKEQVKIVKEIRDLVNNEILSTYRNVKEFHITIAAQCSFVMRLAADMNQNHFPEVIKVYHYEKSGYPWCFELSPNQDSLKFALSNNELKVNV
jgi:hypothetical protein